MTRTPATRREVSLSRCQPTSPSAGDPVPRSATGEGSPTSAHSSILLDLNHRAGRRGKLADLAGVPRLRGFAFRQAPKPRKRGTPANSPHFPFDPSVFAPRERQAEGFDRSPSNSTINLSPPTPHGKP